MENRHDLVPHEGTPKCAEGGRHQVLCVESEEGFLLIFRWSGFEPSCEKNRRGYLGIA